ncbi:hypothetical protein HCUR_01263 [Holospora curviuscula]|uniref:Uncharacterized protein n=1 Tax=Holospora curviuscula TaxID=1082868 RepID=A0A2S5R7L4_9PROT|nr:hypothetical protein HCUR_01263 [Holospora curviuscula]
MFKNFTLLNGVLIYQSIIKIGIFHPENFSIKKLLLF